MGCGFSSAREAKDNNDNKEYVNCNNGRANSAATKDAESKNSLGDMFTTTLGVSGGGADRFSDRMANANARHTNLVNGNTVHQQSEATSSQINFFRMLDEKIENGIEFDDLEEEEFRKEQLLRSVAEWESIVARANGLNHNNNNNNNGRPLARSSSTTPPSPSSSCSVGSPSTARPKSGVATSRSVAMTAWTSAPRTPSAALSRSASADNSGAPAVTRSIGLAKVLVDTQRT